MLSICSLMIFVTANIPNSTLTKELWFAFDLFFDDICYSQTITKELRAKVVICFRFVLWWYLLQQKNVLKPNQSRCDLLSICSLMIFVTATGSGITKARQLWFAFDLFFDDICYSSYIGVDDDHVLWFAFDLFFDDICYSI